ncbi:MAG TPA: hypothetical protein VFA43_10665 [Gemmatimonadaceae bacterium]|nr:hypothetical protein [Gemmatimonadaceae bacterium]
MIKVKVTSDTPRLGVTDDRLRTVLTFTVEATVPPNSREYEELIRLCTAHEAWISDSAPR